MKNFSKTNSETKKIKRGSGMFDENGREIFEGDYLYNRAQEEFWYGYDSEQEDFVLVDPVGDILTLTPTIAARMEIYRG